MFSCGRKKTLKWGGLESVNANPIWTDDSAVKQVYESIYEIDENLHHIFIQYVEGVPASSLSLA